jgi:hypothetical protein
MKIKDIKNYSIINESLLLEDPVYRSFKQVGQKLMEANLTTQQIEQIFTSVEQQATAAPGGNRTMIGKGKDAASAVNKAWEGLKTKMQNSGPVQGFDQKVSDVLSKIGVGSADPQFNGEVNKWVQKYRDFAKKHPVAQGAIYAALIAVAGISGAGLAGAAALGLLKMADKLLQGERFTSAAYSGAKTGALAYGAGQLGQAIKGSPDPAVPGPVDSSAATGAAQNTLAATRQAVEKEAMDAIRSRIANGDIAPDNTSAIRDLAYKMLDGSGMPAQSIESSVEKLVTRSLGDLAQQAGGQAVVQGGKLVRESIHLSESQIHLVIGKIIERQRKLDEAIPGAGLLKRAGDYIQTKGKNITTKITADKLLQAWKKGGSKTDSLDVAKVIQNAGVPSATIKQVYNSMKIPFAGEPGAQPAMTRNIPVNKPVPTPSTAPAGAAPASTATQPAAGAPATTATQPPSYNAANVTNMPGMAQNAKPKPANFASPSSYGQTTMSVKAPAAATAPAQAAPAAAADHQPQVGGKIYDAIKRNLALIGAEEKQDIVSLLQTADASAAVTEQKKYQTKPDAASTVQKESQEKCPHCGGPMFSETLKEEKKDACYHKVKGRYKVWPSAYASGALVQCRKKGAANWGSKS